MARYTSMGAYSGCSRVVELRRLGDHRRHGGDAWNGYMKDGRYFVSQHGHDTEVSRTFWVYSYYHTVFLWITHLSAIAAFGFYYLHALRQPTV